MPARSALPHHLELRRDTDVDDEVAGWLREGAAAA
jgi:hypothetical protein